MRGVGGGTQSCRPAQHPLCCPHGSGLVSAVQGSHGCAVGSSLSGEVSVTRTESVWLGGMPWCLLCGHGTSEEMMGGHGVEDEEGIGKVPR